MSRWSKELRAVLGIVLVGFSAATVATLLDETPSNQRQTLLHADSSQKPLSDPAMIANHPRGLEVALIDSEPALRLVGATQTNVQDLRFAFAHPQAVQFSFERQLTFDTYDVR